MIDLEKIGIVIQGTLYNDFCTNQIIDAYKTMKKNCVISTWSNEPKELIDKLINNEYNVVINDQPTFKGHHNCNLQTLSSHYGIEFLEKQDKYSHLLRMRTDLISNDILKFLTMLSKISISDPSKIILLCWINGYETHYFTDFFTFGKIEESKKFWNVSQQIEDEDCHMFTEQYLCYKYTQKKFPKYSDISNFFSFSVKELHENNIKLSWTKPNRNWGEQIERTMTLLKKEILLDY